MSYRTPKTTTEAKAALARLQDRIVDYHRREREHRDSADTHTGPEAA
jgi:hypothetical protein